MCLSPHTVKEKFKIPSEQHLRVFDSLDIELDDDDVFERTIENPSTLVLTIKYDAGLFQLNPLIQSFV